MSNKSLHDITALSRRVEDAAVIQWVARSKALGVRGDVLAEMGAPQRAVALTKTLDTGGLAAAGATGAIMAFIQNAGRTSAFLSMVAERAFRRAPINTPLLHSGTTAIPQGMIEGETIPVAELSLQGAQISPQSVGTIVVATKEAWRQIDGPGQGYINNLLQEAVGAAADTVLFDGLAGGTPITFTAADSTEAEVVSAMRLAIAALLTKSGQVLRWAISPAFAAALTGMSADGRISVGPEGGTIFGIPAYVTDGLDGIEAALIAASDIAADVIDLEVNPSHAATLQLPSGDKLSLFQNNLIAVRAILSYGFQPLADDVMAKVVISEES